ncbi:MAG: endonuclease MutS2 [Firmicutes bacterium]|nr:endonuclease MutS2 [Bacillota bacterium]
MDQRSIKKLEFDKIIALLSEHCNFAPSRELAEKLLPSTESYEAARLLAETDEARELLRLYPLFTCGGLWDVRPHLRKAEIGGVLDPEELVEISALCRAARTTKVFFSELKGNFPILTGLGRSLVFIRTVESAVEKAIGPDLSVNDDASERLASIRRKKAAKAEQVRARLDSLIKNPTTVRYLQDPIITIRDNIYVVPVKQEYRGQIAGVVHDTSGSGATLFVEPLAVMELNNELTALAKEEQEEIAAILRGLTLVVSRFAAEINADLVMLARIDFIASKGQLSYDLDAAAPKINDSGFIRLIKARHPLIPAARVVPVDVELGRDISAMVITGPNTGGKTVTLKTIGLLTCMALAGLHIPADEGSEIACFDRVCADIGDEQSIEQSLSTFSSHMTNIVDILREADERSLLLFDELGAGTDPTEGAALAMAILKHAQSLGAKTVATTHYSELKAFAYNTPGFINASMEFDVTTLSPTFRLLMGMPGKSNAFEISRRLGLPESIIEEAAANLSSDDAAVAAMLSNLEDMRRELAAEKEKAAAYASSSAGREKRLREKEQQLAAKEADVLRRANEKAQGIVDDTLAKSRALFQEEQERIAQKESAQKAWQESQRKLKSLREQLEEETPAPVFAGEAPKEVRLGEAVFLPRLNQHGSVVALPDKDGQVTVQLGVVKMKAPLSDLRLSKEDPSVKKGRRRGSGNTTADMTFRKSVSVESSLDLHGMDTMEALPVLDKYIDDAFIAGLRTVEINHGRGTGALRKFVHDYLRDHRLVKAYRDGSFHEGGIGVTIVELNI